MTFENGEFRPLRYSGIVRNFDVTHYGVSDLAGAYELMREGYSESLTVNLVPCPPDAVSTTITNGGTTSYYTWQTSVSSGSIFKSPNRAINVTVVDGIAELISFRRFQERSCSILAGGSEPPFPLP